MSSLAVCWRTFLWSTLPCHTLSLLSHHTLLSLPKGSCLSWSPCLREMRRSRTTWWRRTEWGSRTRGPRPSNSSKLFWSGWWPVRGAPSLLQYLSNYSCCPCSLRSCLLSLYLSPCSLYLILYTFVWSALKWTADFHSVPVFVHL